jgi:RsfA family transcription factor
MRKARQDAWTKDEDIVLAEIVLRYIRNGKTQLEAFKQAAKSLSRTSSACGFRWNAAIRKQHLEAIEIAKNQRKQLTFTTPPSEMEGNPQSIDSVISLLQKMRDHDLANQREEKDDVAALTASLQAENEELRTIIKRYQEAWHEIGRVWEWIGQTNKQENRNEH